MCDRQINNNYNGRQDSLIFLFDLAIKPYWWVDFIRNLYGLKYNRRQIRFGFTTGQMFNEY